jgi:hypothetical protein
MVPSLHTSLIPPMEFRLSDQLHWCLSSVAYVSFNRNTATAFISCFLRFFQQKHSHTDLYLVFPTFLSTETQPQPLYRVSYVYFNRNKATLIFISCFLRFFQQKHSHTYLYLEFLTFLPTETQPHLSLSRVSYVSFNRNTATFIFISCFLHFFQQKHSHTDLYLEFPTFLPTETQPHLSLSRCFLRFFQEKHSHTYLYLEFPRFLSTETQLHLSLSRVS